MPVRNSKRARPARKLGEYRTALRQPTSLVDDLHAELLDLRRQTTHPLPDPQSDLLTGQIYELTVRLSNTPAAAAAEIEVKLAVLCQRLREHLHPDHRGELLSYLLAESVREDCRIWLAAVSATPASDAMR